MPNPLEAKWPNLPVGKIALTDKSGNEYNSSNPLPTTATLAGDVNVDSNIAGGGYLVGKSSGGDFTTAYASGTTITITNLPSYHGTLIDQDIISIYQVLTTGAINTIYNRDDNIMTVAGNVITVNGATFNATDSFIVYTNIHRDIDLVTNDSAAPSRARLIAGVYESTPDDNDNGDGVNLLLDIKGRAQTLEAGAWAYTSDSIDSKAGAAANVTGSDPHFDSDADNSAQVMKAAAGNIYKIIIYNPNSSIAFIQLFDEASGSVVVGTTTPAEVIPVPAEGSSEIDWGCSPLTFGTAITYAATTTATGSGDPTTGLTLSAAYK